MQNIDNLGLNQNEALVYQALLELGPARVSSISKKAGLNRTTSYDILNRLMLHGLVAPASGIGTRRKYVAEHPTRLVQHLERQQKKAERALALVREKLPELALLYKTVQKPSIKFFEGTEGLKQIYEETLKSKEEILCILDCEGFESELLESWSTHYVRKRAKLKIQERVLGFETPKTVAWLENYPASKKYTHYKYIPRGTFPFFYTEMNIFDDKVMIALLKQPNRMGILIQSQQFADILKAMFELIWKSLPDTQKKK